MDVTKFKKMYSAVCFIQGSPVISGLLISRQYLTKFGGHKASGDLDPDLVEARY